MVSILDLQGRADKADEPLASRPSPASQNDEHAEPAPSIAEPAVEKPEFELVVGRRQIASLLFVSTVLVMICVAAAYMAGKAMSGKIPASAASPIAAAPSVIHEPDPPPINLNQEPAPEAPLFAEPRNGSVYIQIGAVERGIALVLAEGLRKRGFQSFVGPGPNEKIFRVLIGPLPDPASYVKAKEKVDQLGLATFARRFPN
jgi:cell division septation protein DedD